LRDKFIECAGSRLDTARIDRIIETCMTIEHLADVGDLMEQLVVED